MGVGSSKPISSIALRVPRDISKFEKQKEGFILLVCVLSLLYTWYWGGWFPPDLPLHAPLPPQG
jgi:hypothetical protein